MTAVRHPVKDAALRFYSKAADVGPGTSYPAFCRAIDPTLVLSQSPRHALTWANGYGHFRSVHQHNRPYVLRTRFAW